MDRLAMARQARRELTEPERLLWSLLRANQLAGLRFRRQHWIDHDRVDFACVSKRLVIELDGPYHDQVIKQDLQRQRRLESKGWRVIRFENDAVRDDADAVCIAICWAVGVPQSFRRRTGRRDGAARSFDPKRKPR